MYWRTIMKTKDGTELIRKSKQELSKKLSLKEDKTFNELYSEIWFMFVNAGGYTTVEKEFTKKAKELKLI